MYSTFFGECSSLKKRSYLRKWGFKWSVPNEYLVNLRRIWLPRYYVTYPSIVKMNGLLSFVMLKFIKGYHCSYRKLLVCFNVFDNI